MNEQQELNLPFGMLKLEIFQPHELMICKTIEDAYFETFRRAKKINKRKLTRKELSARTGIDASTLSRIFSGTKNMPKDKERSFYIACGNYYAEQWKAFNDGFLLTPRELTEQEKARLFDEMQMKTG